MTYNPYLRRNTHEESLRNSARDAEIRRRKLAGETAKHLAREYGLSPERIYELAHRGRTQSQRAGIPIYGKRGSIKRQRGLWQHDDV